MGAAIAFLSTNLGKYPTSWGMDLLNSLRSIKKRESKGVVSSFFVPPNGEAKMKVNKVDHICIAVKNLDEARKIWEPVLGKSKPDVEYIDESEKIKVARYWVGEVGFELMESTTPDGDVAKFIEKRGEGIMLISLNVDNTREAMGELQQQDYPFIGGARPFRDCEFAFLHPQKMNGVLLELIDDKQGEFEER